MSIKDCPNCNGTGWLPKGYKDKSWHPALHIPGRPPPAEQWEPCWCNYGKVAEGQPAFWKDRERVQQVFFCSHEDLEKAVSNFLKQIEPFVSRLLAKRLTKHAHQGLVILLPFLRCLKAGV